MFKKNIVKEVGSYSEKYHLFEDYYLWIRILKNNSYVKNISKELVKMRTSPDLYARRGGVAYAKDMMRFHKWMLREILSFVHYHMLLFVLYRIVLGR